MTLFVNFTGTVICILAGADHRVEVEVVRDRKPERQDQRLEGGEPGEGAGAQIEGVQVSL